MRYVCGGCRTRDTTIVDLMRFKRAVNELEAAAEKNPWRVMTLRKMRKRIMKALEGSEE